METPQPSDIIWENKEIGRITRASRYASVNIFLQIVILFSFYNVFQLKNIG